LAQFFHIFHGRLALLALTLFVSSCGDSPSSPSETTTTTQAAPTITAVEPAAASVDGGTSVIITGSGFSGETTVVFGETAASSFLIDSETSITAVSPAGSLKTVEIVVTTPGGPTATSDASRFTWLANGPTSLTLSDSSVKAGGSIRGTVTVSYPAPPTGIRLPLKWQSTVPASSALLFPASVPIAAGATEGTFQISTFYTSVREDVEVVCERWGLAQTVRFTVLPQ